MDNADRIASMEKPTTYQVIAAATLAVASYFARYEFETIKNIAAEDRSTVKDLQTKLTTVDKNVAILLERTTPKAARQN